jgi:hypothetical protein
VTSSSPPTPAEQLDRPDLPISRGRVPYWSGAGGRPLTAGAAVEARGAYRGL